MIALTQEVAGVVKETAGAHVPALQPAFFGALGALRRRLAAAVSASYSSSASSSASFSATSAPSPAVASAA